LALARDAIQVFGGEHMERRNGRNTRKIRRSVALVVAGAAGAVMGAVQHAGASVVDVVLSRTSDGNASVGNTSLTNNGITPVTYTPSTLTIPDAPEASPTQTYDAADEADPGTTWNELLCPSAGTSVNNTTGSTITTIYQQNIPLVNSLGASTGVQLSLSFTEANGKDDTVHNIGIASSTGTDGLAANPVLNTSSNPSTQGLMEQSWFDNGTTEEINFGLTGLIPGHEYNLYVYGSGNTTGNGGTYTVPTANQGTGYNTSSGFYSTEPTGVIDRSVFDSTGINPLPEEGLTWTVLPVMADGNGDLTFSVNKDVSSTSKGVVNGFQLDDLTLVPEPASIGLLAMSGLTLMARSRKRRT
jgi:hypothetical protein